MTIVKFEISYEVADTRKAIKRAISDIEEDSSNEAENNSSEVEDNSNLAEENLNEAVVAVPDFWEKANKDELLFLFDNAFSIKSSVLTNFLIDSLSLLLRQVPEISQPLDINLMAKA